MLIINLQTNESATKQGQWWNINYSHFLLQKMAALWRVITECGYRDRLKDVRVQYTGRFAYVVQALVPNVMTEDQFHGREDRHEADGNLMVTIGPKDVEPMNNGYLPSLAAKMSNWIRPCSTYRVTILERKGKRKVPDMEAVADALALHYPVKVLSFAGLPIGSQMDAMMSASLVIACHGAELANAIFLRPGAALLEIMPYGFSAPYYGDLCTLVGARHAQLWGSNPPPAHADETCESLRVQTHAMSVKRFACREVSWIEVEPNAIIGAARTLLAQ